MISLCSKVCLASFAFAVTQGFEETTLFSLDADNDCGHASGQGSECALSAIQLRASPNSDLGNETEESSESESSPKLNASDEPGDNSSGLGSSPIWHYALDCWWGCHETAGYCPDYCGSGNACCRWNHEGPEECKRVTFWPIMHAHTCVQLYPPETTAPPAVVTDPPTSEPPADGTDAPGDVVSSSPPPDAAAPCADESPYCGPWAAQGQCTENAGYMGSKCKKSCGLCPGAGSGETLSTEPAATSATEPQDSSALAPDADSAAAATDGTPSTAEARTPSSSVKIGAGVNGTSCSAYPACVAVKIDTGDCCPNADGVSLGCCNGFPEVQEVVEVAAGTECSAFAGCVRLGLETGACCPTASGARLGCCDDDAKPSAPVLEDEQPATSEPTSAESES